VRGNNTGLFEEMDVYFRYYETKFDDFGSMPAGCSARAGCWPPFHCDTTRDCFTLFQDLSALLLDRMSRWIYNELWGYWLVTGDRDFLRDRVVPALA
jgi:hypothetical protein